MNLALLKELDIEIVERKNVRLVTLLPEESHQEVAHAKKHNLGEDLRSNNFEEGKYDENYGQKLTKIFYMFQMDK